jgi:serine/threonine-protein kinase
MTEPSAQDAARDMIGVVIEGRYRLVARLGDGSIGSVYRAEDLGGGAPAAIKIWRASVLDMQAAGRFHRETKALATLEHPHIVAIRDYGLVDGLPYLAMELLLGESLADRLTLRPRLPLEEALAITRQMLEALQYAHQRNVVHRDLKPENVFLVGRGARAPEVKLLDYGLAKFLLVEDDPIQGALLTRKGMMVGTPLYVAPEQALGAAIDARADVYSVGCVLYEMLSGEPPFFEESVADLLRAHLAAPIPKLRERVPGLPRLDELQTFIERAMAKNAVDRFSDAGAMLAALPLPAGVLAAAARAARSATARPEVPSPSPSPHPEPQPTLATTEPKAELAPPQAAKSMWPWLLMIGIGVALAVLWLLGGLPR